MKHLCPSHHPVLEFRGSSRQCGREYGNSQREAIVGMIDKDMSPVSKWLAYGRRSWSEFRTWHRPTSEFILGMAEGANLPVEEICVLLLREEINKLRDPTSRNCTSFGATGAGTRDGTAIIGMSWDGLRRDYAWAGLVRLTTDTMPATFTYAYPGLWACAGMNEHGLSLVWNSVSTLKPKPGIPTYVLVAGILACKNCREVRALLKRTRNAGCFVFTIGDAEGEVWVIEGLSNITDAIPCHDIIGRGNRCEGKLAKRFEKPAPGSRTRFERIIELLQAHYGHIDRFAAETFLRDHDEAHTTGCQGICQHTVPWISVDSFYALPSRRELWIARGSPCRHKFHKYLV